MKKQLEKFERKFASNIWQRGREYYREGLIGNIVKNGDMIKAESYGNSTYRLKLDLENIDMTCSCPCDFYCKHLAALIIWLKNNKVADISDQIQYLRLKTKEELISIITNILNKNPRLIVYTQTMDKKAVSDLIRKVWLPRYEHDADFFNKLDLIKEETLNKKDSELIIQFLRKLIDMYDHNPDSYELTDYIVDFLIDIEQLKLTKKETKEIEEMTEDYPFEY